MSDIRPLKYTYWIVDSPVGHPTPPHGEPATWPTQPVRRAHEQVADQLRGLMLDGRLRCGERLPTEAELSRRFRVSRATVREALRLLSAEGLVRTRKGAGGGSYLTLPTVGHISDALQSSITLLSASRELSLDDLLEVRELLEVPAAGRAARRREAGHVHHLRQSIPSEPLALGTHAQFDHNREFHARLIDSCENPLLSIAARPIFGVLQTNLARAGLGERFHTSVNHDHVTITDAIQARAPRMAERAMRAHLRFLRPYYERAWQRALDDAERVAAVVGGG